MYNNKSLNYYILKIFIILQCTVLSQDWIRSHGPYAGKYELASDENYLFASDGSSVYRTDDGGNTWEHLIDFGSITDLEIFEDVLFVASWGGILRTYDYGVTWDTLYIDGSRIHDIFLNAPGNIYAGTHTGVFHSNDYGNTWNHIFVYPIIESIFIDSQNNIYASQRFDGIHVSHDNGQTWMHTFDHITQNSFIENSQGRILTSSMYLIYSDDHGLTWINTDFEVYIEDFIFTNNNRLYAGSYYQGVYYSDDGGITWENNGLIHPVIRSFALDSNDGIYCSSNLYGIFLNSDQGDNWIQVGTPYSYANILSLHAMNDNIILAGANYQVSGQGGGVFISQNSGLHWTTTNLTLTRVSSLTSNTNNIIFAGSNYGGGIHRSQDYGNSWELVNNGLQNSAITSLNSCGDIIFAGTWEGLYWSDNNGDYWNLTSLDTGQTYCVVPYSNVLLAGTHNYADTTSGVYISYDSGQNWEIRGLETIGTYALVITEAGNIVAGTELGIYRSINGGISWDDVFSDFGITSLTITPDSIIYAASNNGVMLSIDDGFTWQSGNGNIIDNAITTLVSTNNGTVLAGTYSSGIFLTNIDTSINLSIEPISEGLLTLELENYPNPFNPITTFSYNLPQRSDVRITIYTLLGREIETLVIENQGAGYKSIQWDASNVASGMYFYQIRAGDFVQTKKMVVLK